MMTSLQRIAAVGAVLSMTLAACGDHDHDHDTGHDQDHDIGAHGPAEAGAHGDHGDHPAGSTAVTQWTERTELFMEYPDLVVGQDARFLIHLTDLSDFSAVTRGPLVCRFESPDGGFEVTVPGPARPGIYIPTIRFERAGTYTLELLLEGPQVRDRIVVEDVTVYASAADAPHAEEEEGGGISFLKEQQWQIEFATAVATRRTLAASVPALGEILAGPRNHAQVPAMVHGVVAADQNRNLPMPGTWVEAGEVLAVIAPPADAGSMLLRIRNEFVLARAEFERAQRLYESKATSKRRLDEARLRFEMEKSTFDRIAVQVDFDADGGVHYHVISPIAGVVDRTVVHLGESVQPGDVLFSVTDPRRVLLEIRVPLSNHRQIAGARDATFVVEGDDAVWRVSDLDGRLVSVGSTIDPQSRTLPVLFELANPDLRLKIHQFVEAALHTGDSVEGPAIPATAILDEGGVPVVYVQTEGEAFERRTVKPGIRDAGMVQILHGVEAGEHIVTRGAYQVRLAALGTPTAGHGHGH